MKKYKKSHKSIAPSDAIDLNNRYFNELEAKKIQIGLRLECSYDWSLQLFVLNLSSSEYCLQNSMTNYNGPKYDINYWGIGPGAGIQYFKIATVCLLDNQREKLKSVNIGLRGNLSFFVGVNGGLSFGMNGVCASYSLDLDIGMGGGIAVGANTITRH